MASNTDLQLWLGAIALCSVVALVRHSRGGLGVGLLFAYVLSFGALHWLGAVPYLLPWYDNEYAGLTVEGLRQSALAIGGFTLGAELARRGFDEVHDTGPSPELVVSTTFVNLCFMAGLVLYVVIFPVAGRIPSLTAIASNGSSLMAVAVGLKCWNAWHESRKAHMWMWLALTSVYPLVTIYGQGFLGYGFAAMITVFGFFVSFQRPKWAEGIVGVLLVYLGLSIYVTYMRDRSDIREVVWGGGSSSERAQQIAGTFTSLEWFNFWDIGHLDRINGRLNQNFLVGAAVVRLEQETVSFARGATFEEAALAVIPRALWPDKPMTAGSGDLVSTYTGLRFAEGTSVGIGQVMECYVNFGTPGVFFGFILIGVLVTRVDIYAAMHVRGGNAQRFLLWYLPGLSLLQVGGSVVEVTAGALASWIVAAGMNAVAGSLERRAAAEVAGNADELQETPYHPGATL